MLYVFYGTDKDTAREKALTLLFSLQKKKPEAELFRIDAEHWSEQAIDELIGGQGLFSKTYLVFLSYLFENEEAKEAVVKKLSAIGESPNIFVMLEGKLDKATLLAVTESAEKALSFEKKGEKKEEFNIFSLTDAFGRRDKRKLWILLQKTFATDAVPEEIHGILFWQLKSMLLASGARSAAEAGIAPFVFTKSKNFLKNYSVPELHNLSSVLVGMYHDAHRGLRDFEIALERFVLTI